MFEFSQWRRKNLRCQYSRSLTKINVISLAGKPKNRLGLTKYLNSIWQGKQNYQKHWGNSEMSSEQLAPSAINYVNELTYYN